MNYDSKDSEFTDFSKQLILTGPKLCGDGEVTSWKVETSRSKDQWQRKKRS